MIDSFDIKVKRNDQSIIFWKIVLDQDFLI